MAAQGALQKPVDEGNGKAMLDAKQKAESGYSLVSRATRLAVSGVSVAPA